MSRNVIAGDREVWHSGPVTAVRYGKVVTVYLPSGKTIPGAAFGKAVGLGTLPDGWRPVSSVVYAYFATDGFRAQLTATNVGLLTAIVDAKGGTATDGGIVLGNSLSLTYVC